MIIGLTGHLGSGKDTVADYLVDHYGFKKVGFSDQLYEAVEALFDIDHAAALQYKNDQNITVGLYNDAALEPLLVEYSFREFLQRFGTEMGRDVWGEDFWVDRFEDEYLEYERKIPDNQDLVVRDVRFNNEAKLLQEYNGFVWLITRPEHDGDAHESEQGIHEGHIVGDIMNDGNLEELYETLTTWMEECYGRRQLSSADSKD